ncbi:hypothetical protein EV122DRAFT_257274, partial [Schizophyllum commune]
MKFYLALFTLFASVSLAAPREEREELVQAIAWAKAESARSLSLGRHGPRRTSVSLRSSSRLLRGQRQISARSSSPERRGPRPT